MKVQDLMTRQVKACRPETNLAEIVREMWECDCGALPVIDDEGRVIGMITDRDVCIAVGTRGRRADSISVREVVQGHVYTCRPTAAVTAALKTMQTHKVRRLPVVDAEGLLRGILSLNDIVTHPGAASARDVLTTLASICEHRHPVAMSGAA